MGNQYEFKNTYIRIGKPFGIQSVLYEPAVQADMSHIAVLAMHSDGDYLSFSVGPELAKRGVTVLCANVHNSGDSLDKKVLDVRKGVEFLRQRHGARKVALMGHSGGATLMTAYQNGAENGAKGFQGPEKIYKASDCFDGLPPADGMMLLDSNWGNAVMTLFSLDPAVTSEDAGQPLNEDLNLFNPANGFKPDGSTFSGEFIRKFQKAQGERNNRLIQSALDRLSVIESGKGKYIDDEPFIVPGATQFLMNNKLFAQDIRLMSHTRKAWPLLRKGGAVTTEVVHSVRIPKNNESITGSYQAGALKTTVRTFLNSFAVQTGADYSYDEDSVSGVEWASCYACPPGNVRGISVPLLLMGMTGSWEYLASETIYENAKSPDKTLAFVEGASHMFTTARECEKFPGQYGDTQKTMYDFAADWLCQKFILRSEQ